MEFKWVAVPELDFSSSFWKQDLRRVYKTRRKAAVTNSWLQLGERERGEIKGKKGFLEDSRWPSLCVLSMLRLDKVTAWPILIRSMENPRYMA